MQCTVYILVYCSSGKLMNARYRINDIEKEGGLPYGLLSLIISLIILQIRNKYFNYLYHFFLLIVYHRQFGDMQG